jgi:4'-phosphopantetheinyl transferase EntD
MDHTLVASALRELLPTAVELATAGPGTPPGPLLGDEPTAVARAVDQRRREFALGRTCARAALERLGVGPAAINVGASREPLWPSGIVGSITHCEGFCAAAVAHATSLLAIGIDVEAVRPLPDGVAELVAAPAERTGAPPIAIFSIKEAVYKALWPLTRTWLDFADVTVSIDDGTRSFTAHIRPDPDRGPVPGRFIVTSGWVAAAVCVPCERRRSATGASGM